MNSFFKGICVLWLILNATTGTTLITTTIAQLKVQTSGSQREAWQNFGTA